MKKSKKILFVILLLILLIVVGLLIWFFTKDLRLSKEEKIVNDLTNMGNEIYMSYYYQSVSSGKNLDETKEFLQKYETIGLKFNLTELEKYSEDFSNKIKNFKNGDKSCDKTNTMVIIYPTSPYGKNNYNVQVSLDCGFKATEEK